MTASDSQAASDSSWWQKFSNCFGCDIKYGFGVGVNINTGSWISVDAKIDLGTYTLTSDGNGISDTDSIGAGLEIGLNGVGSVSIGVESQIDASDSDDYLDHVKNAWENRNLENKTDATLDISKSVDLTSSTDNDDIKLGIGGQFFIGLDIWVNLTDLWELLTN